MVFLHGGMLCPAELAALAASMPFFVALWHWLRCRVATRLRRKPTNPYLLPGGKAIRFKPLARIRTTKRKKDPT